MKIVIAEAKNERVLNYINFTNQVKVQKLIDLTNKRLPQKLRVVFEPENVRQQMEQLRDAEIYNQLKEGGSNSKVTNIHLTKEEAIVGSLNQGFREL